MRATLQLTAATMFAIALHTPLMAQDADRIDGFQTNDFVRIFPDGDQAPAGYQQSGVNTDPSLHLATADYDADDGASFAHIRVIAWPPENPEPIANGDAEVLEQSLAGALAMIEDEGFAEPATLEFTTDDGVELACLQTEQNPQVEFIYCATTMKGRVMEIQHFASIEARDEQARSDVAERFVGALVDFMAAAE